MAVSHKNDGTSQPDTESPTTTTDPCDNVHSHDDGHRQLQETQTGTSGMKTSSSSPRPPPRSEISQPERKPVKDSVSKSPQSRSSRMIYFSTAVLGVMCAVSVYQFCRSLPPSDSSSSSGARLVECLENHGYSGDQHTWVKKRHYGSPDLLTEESKEKLVAGWSDEGLPPRTEGAVDSGSGVKEGEGVEDGVGGGGGGGSEEGAEEVQGAEEQYVIVFDAGSTGTRLHVFTFQKKNGGIKLNKELFRYITPGLSEFVSDAEKGALTLQPMIEAALRAVPARLHGSTPLVFKATAGFRLLGTAGANRLLTKIRERFAQTDFLYTPEDISILSPTEEGLYAWITINYLTGQLDGDSLTSATVDLGGASMQLTYLPPHGARGQVRAKSLLQYDNRLYDLRLSPLPCQLDGDSLTSATVDLGGASMQLTYLPPHGEKPLEALHHLELMSSDYSLYTHSYLGVGLLAARHSTFQKRDDGVLTGDCLPAGYSGTFTFGGQSYPVRGLESPSQDECWGQVGGFLASTQIQTPWDIVGQRGHRSEFYLISYFHEALAWAGVWSNETEKIVTLKDFYEASYKVCKNPDPKMPFLCQDLTYITRLLGEGFMLWNIPLHVVREIDSVETSWALGAALKELSKTQA
ncbi:hypothetical protein ACOMHN_058670 [Nucella lapillus]